ncbi:hypothetical protein BC832DRAFT_563364 [Gaertneriomyces semiglobifer]|nr:hypothetical protein BC832DRAFT_563364 [Gaertneriomyces semiglobifer]
MKVQSVLFTHPFVFFNSVRLASSGTSVDTLKGFVARMYRSLFLPPHHQSNPLNTQLQSTSVSAASNVILLFYSRPH